MSLFFTAPSKTRDYYPYLAVQEGGIQDQAQGHITKTGQSWDSKPGLSNPKVPCVYLPLAATEGNPGHSVWGLKPVPQDLGLPWAGGGETLEAVRLHRALVKEIEFWCQTAKHSFPLCSKSQIPFLKIGDDSMYLLGLVGRINKIMHRIHRKCKSPLHFSSINIISDSSFRSIFEKGYIYMKQVYNWRLIEIWGWKVVSCFWRVPSSKTASSLCKVMCVINCNQLLST